MEGDDVFLLLFSPNKSWLHVEKLKCSIVQISFEIFARIKYVKNEGQQSLMLYCILVVVVPIKISVKY